MKILIKNGKKILLNDSGVIQNAMDIENPNVLQVPYTQALAHFAIVYNHEAKRILFIGGGACLTPKAFLKIFPDARIDIVEIDGKVINIAIEEFNLNTRKFQIIIEDGK